MHQDEIDDFGGIYSSYPPECQITIDAIDSPDTVPTLKYAVPVEGICTKKQLTLYIVRTLRSIHASTGKRSYTSSVVYIIYNSWNK